MTPEQIDKAIEEHFSSSLEDQRQWLRLVLETGERLVSLTMELGSGAGLAMWDRGAYNDYIYDMRRRNNDNMDNARSRSTLRGNNDATRN